MTSSSLGRDQTTAIFFIVMSIGIIALGAGFLVGFEPRVMSGIALGCIPAGVLGVGGSMWARHWVTANYPGWIQRERNAADERTTQIRHHAGHTAFWALFAYVFFYALLSPTAVIGGVSHTTFASITLVLSAAAYWVALLVYSRRY